MKRRKNLVGKEELLDAVRAAIKSAGGKRIRLNSFLGASDGIKTGDIYQHFPSWDALLRAAGFHFTRHNQRIEDSVLLADWGTVARKLQRVPSAQEYRRYGGCSISAITRRFKNWNSIPGAFRAFATAQTQWEDVVSLLPPLSKEPPSRRHRESGAAHYGALSSSASGIRHPSFRLPKANGRPLTGSPLEIDGMRNAPVNEIGVIFLFALLATRLGFHIESLQSRFPDCEARRLLRPGIWQTVRIEFEFESRNFHDHGHPAEGCDIIVCWEHNWPGCPENLEVIALSDEIRR